MKYDLLLIVLLLSVPIASGERINTTILARGDSISFNMGETTPASFWIFSVAGLDHIYDINSTRYENGTYWIDIDSKQSASLDPGYYTAATQYYGPNKIKEARYVERYNATMWTDQNPIVDQYLVSPFKAVKDIPLNGLQPNMVLRELQTMLKNSDDTLILSNLTVQEPLTEIHEILQVTNNSAYIYGTSNLKVGTPISVLWDAERQVSPQDYRLNTFKTTVQAGNTSLGQEQNRWFDLDINVTIQDLPPGKHWVEVTANDHITRYAYNVGEIWQNQTPPPMQKIRYLNDGVIVTPTPERIEVPVPGPTQYVTVIQTVIIPTQPFPKDALGNEYNPFTVQNVSWIAVPALIALVLLFIVKKYLDMRKRE